MALAMGLTMAVLAADTARGQTASWRGAVDSALGRAGTLQPDSAYKFGFPRSDLDVTVGSVKLRPSLALGAWVAFLPVGRSESIVMGDLVLTEAEIDPVMRALQAGGVEQTALHNHLRGETPHVMYMHIMARGNPVAIARTIRTALAGTGTPAPMQPSTNAAAIAVDLDTTGIASALGRKGKLNGGVYQVSVPRAEVIRAGGVVIPPSMGVSTAINIQPTGAGRAVATGDFVLRPAEVNRVIRALRGHGIEVTALHSHLLDESPRLFFMHFWAEDDAVVIARGLRSALDLTNSRSAK
ncbi:MAG TPA: DUF1259 domain-containing protein [Gemmatimonadaceae bacterium]